LYYLQIAQKHKPLHISLTGQITASNVVNINIYFFISVKPMTVEYFLLLSRVVGLYFIIQLLIEETSEWQGMK